MSRPADTGNPDMIYSGSHTMRKRIANIIRRMRDGAISPLRSSTLLTRMVGLDVKESYEHLRKLSIPHGLWFCMPSENAQRFFGWAIPPYTIQKDFHIKANGTPCNIETVSHIQPEIQAYFDRFGIGDQSRRNVFYFSLPAMSVSDETIITCQFSNEASSVFYSFFRSNAPQVETPAFNMMRVARSDNFGYFSLMGYTQYRHIKAIIEKNAPNTSAILDWGCGAARVLRYFANDPQIRTVGVDVDSYNISWCKQVFGDWADFRIIEPTQPCPFPNESFDLVYGISVFTHLNRDSERFWLNELRRLLKPGGIAVMTVHGEMTFFKAINDPGTYIRFVREGFLDVGACADLRVDGQETLSEELYSNVFHTRPYIETIWGHYFRVLDYIPGGSTAHQDYVIMVRE